MADALWTHKELHRIDHRLIWWFLACMKPDGVVAEGWRQRAMVELRIPQSTLFEAQVRLRAAGVIEYRPYDRHITLLAEAFLL